ncbi:MAG: hypothetical protein WCE84_01190, partial [Candidatus Rhabdochlamydia sp.]
VRRSTLIPGAEEAGLPGALVWEIAGAGKSMVIKGIMDISRWNEIIYYLPPASESAKARQRRYGLVLTVFYPILMFRPVREHVPRMLGPFCRLIIDRVHAPALAYRGDPWLVFPSGSFRCVNCI